MPTKAEIEAAMTPAGAWTRETLASWGVPWPPPKGWKDRLLATADDELRYLEEAEAHAGEGPLGEPAARGILQIALRLARQQQRPRNIAPGCPRASRLHAPLRFCPDCPEGDACELPSEQTAASPFEAMKAEEARIMQDWRWGNLTKLGVANHLRRAGFDLRYATDKANSLPTPAQEVDETERLRSRVAELEEVLSPFDRQARSIGLRPEQDKYSFAGTGLSNGDLRRASRALSTDKGEASRG